MHFCICKKCFKKNASFPFTGFSLELLFQSTFCIHHDPTAKLPCLLALLLSVSFQLHHLVLQLFMFFLAMISFWQLFGFLILIGFAFKKRVIIKHSSVLTRLFPWLFTHQAFLGWPNLHHFQVLSLSFLSAFCFWWFNINLEINKLQLNDYNTLVFT